METLTKEDLKKYKTNLEKQKTELGHELREINIELIEIVGIIRWINQMINRMG